MTDTTRVPTESAQASLSPDDALEAVAQIRTGARRLFDAFSGAGLHEWAELTTTVIDAADDLRDALSGDGEAKPVAMLTRYRVPGNGLGYRLNFPAAQSGRTCAQGNEAELRKLAELHGWIVDDSLIGARA